ncbi:MAG TPA: universal stress protein [Nitrospiria bacterium]|nr:universal stress protein [Nitrospiria bacterium]
MPDLKRILCPVDFSTFSVSAYRHALSLAHHFRAALSVVHIVELWRYPSADFAASAESFEAFCRTLSEKSREQLQDLVTRYPSDETKLECVVQHGDASESILSIAKAQHADMIVMGTHGRRGVDRLMLGSVTERVMRKALCPVLVVRQSPHGRLSPEEPGDPVRLRRLLYCTDFSGPAQRALDYALSLATEYDAELILLHVLEGLPGSADQAKATATVSDQLETLIPQGRRQTGGMACAARVGRPYQQIIQLAAEAKIDLVIMGVRGRGALDLAVFGSTTYRVIQLGPCPVLVVPV